MDSIETMAPIVKGRLRARAAAAQDDLDRLLALRALCFRGDATASDSDDFDSASDHLLIEDTETGAVVGGFRLRQFVGAAVRESYTAQFYDLAKLHDFSTPMLELGRFCLHPDHHDADLLRLAWGAITRRVDGAGVGLLFGCSSFAGCDPTPYGDSFALLRDRHGAPDCWAPRVKAPEVVRFGDLAPSDCRVNAVKSLPALLRTYLTMGGWVSDHAVIDRTLGTLHVFTGLEIGLVPPARARLLRAVAG